MGDKGAKAEADIDPALFNWYSIFLNSASRVSAEPSETRLRKSDPSAFPMLHGGLAVISGGGRHGFDEADQAARQTGVSHLHSLVM